MGWSLANDSASQGAEGWQARMCAEWAIVVVNGNEFVTHDSV